MENIVGIVLMLVGSMGAGFLISGGIESSKREAFETHNAEVIAQVCPVEDSLWKHWVDSADLPRQKTEERGSVLRGFRAHFPVGPEEGFERLAELRLSGPGRRATDLELETDASGVVASLNADSIALRDLDSLRAMMMGAVGVPRFSSSRILARLMLDSATGAIRRFRFVSVDGKESMNPEISVKWDDSLSGLGAGVRSPESILKVIRANVGGFQAIHTEYLKLAPTFSGKISVKFTIASTGKIVATELAASELNCAKLDREILSRLRIMRFEEIPSGNVTVTYAIVLNRGK